MLFRNFGVWYCGLRLVFIGMKRITIFIPLVGVSDPTPHLCLSPILSWDARVILPQWIELSERGWSRCPSNVGKLASDSSSSLNQVPVGPLVAESRGGR